MTNADERNVLAQGIKDLDEIVERVRSQHRRSRVTLYLLAAVFILLIGLGALAWNARLHANENREQREDLELVVENQRKLIADLKMTQARQLRASDAVILEACRSRNEANRQIRAEFRRAYLNVYRLGDRTPERRAAIQDLIDGIASAERQDRDCGGGPGLGPYDYPQPKREP